MINSKPNSNTVKPTLVKYHLKLFRGGSRYFLSRKAVLTHLGPGYKVRANRVPSRGYDVFQVSVDSTTWDGNPDMWLVGHIVEF